MKELNIDTRFVASEGESVNLKKFRKALDSGLSRDEAAFKTVTGRWAEAKGFTKVKFFDGINVFGDNINRYDEFNRVEVIFFK